MTQELINQNQIGQNFEAQMGREIFGKERARSSLDKALATEDIAEIKRLIAKENLTREDFSQMIYHLNSTEMKLLNLDTHTQYILLKFFVWVREYVRHAQKFYDVEAKIKSNSEAIFSPEDVPSLNETMSKVGLDLFEQAKRSIILDAKFMIDVFLGMARSTLSLGATGFQKTLTESHEIEYGIKTPQVTK